MSWKFSQLILVLTIAVATPAVFVFAACSKSCHETDWSKTITVVNGMMGTYCVFNDTDDLGFRAGPQMHSTPSGEVHTATMQQVTCHFYDPSQCTSSCPPEAFPSATKAWGAQHANQGALDFFSPYLYSGCRPAGAQ